MIFEQIMTSHMANFLMMNYRNKMSSSLHCRKPELYAIVLQKTVQCFHNYGLSHLEKTELQGELSHRSFSWEPIQLLTYRPHRHMPFSLRLWHHQLQEYSDDKRSSSALWHWTIWEIRPRRRNPLWMEQVSICDFLSVHKWTWKNDGSCWMFANNGRENLLEKRYLQSTDLNSKINVTSRRCRILQW